MYQKSKLNVHRDIFLNQQRVVVGMVDAAKTRYYATKLSECDAKSTFQAVNTLLKPSSATALAGSIPKTEMPSAFGTFFEEKVKNIWYILYGISEPSTPRSVGITSTVTTMTAFTPVSHEDVWHYIIKRPTKSCGLDPLAMWLLKEPDVLDCLLSHLTKCVNASLSAGVFPQDLKSAVMRPHIKKASLDQDLLKNYRPVSNLPFLSKLIERIVADQLIEHLEKNMLFNPLQSAYHRGHSTETALLRVNSDIDMALDRGEGTLLLLFDLSAAFDTVDNTTLLNRLERELGVQAISLEWVRPYLTDRTQIVEVGSFRSQEFPLTIYCFCATCSRCQRYFVSTPSPDIVIRMTFSYITTSNWWISAVFEKPFNPWKHVYPR